MAAIVPPWPPAIADIRWTLESNTSRFTSPLSKSTQLAAKAGARWRARVRMPNLTDTELHTWRSFLLKCQDEGRSFLLGPNYPRGRPLAYPGTDTIPWGNGGSYPHPRVNGSGQTGFSLVCNAFANGATMKRGDVFAFHNGSWRELHMLTKDGTADGSGNLTIEFVPAIRISPGHRTLLFFDGYATDPYARAAGEFVIAEQPQGWAESNDYTTDLEFDAYEPLYDFTPDTLSNLAAWYRWRQGVSTDGFGVTQWADQSGNARHLNQATDISKAAIDDDNTIVFDGSNDYLKASPFTLNQAFTVYMLLNQTTWSSNDYIWDGDAGGSTLLRQRSGGASPQLSIFAGNDVGNDANLPLTTWGVVSVVMNGASSFLGVNLNAGATLNPGAQNAGGLTLGCRGDATLFSNIKARELVVFSAAHDAATRKKVIEYLAHLGGVTL